MYHLPNYCYINHHFISLLILRAKEFTKVIS
jgi:hypothetical protein